ncbi:nitrate- and nitrite sensing domain-containing protein, partial [Streptomyces sp. T-3]|nr:nitrate- and nitrite sensing domain-containing protein [Streptomyces sp. T-3]
MRRRSGGKTPESRPDQQEAVLGEDPGQDPDTAGTKGSGPAKGAGRPARVRNRLIIAVAVVAATVAGAGSPGIMASSSQLAESQRLVTLSELTQQAVTLAHSLADERDEATSYIAAGRPKGKAAQGITGTTTRHSGRVDRQIAELRGEAPAAVRRDLDAVPDVRRAALTG